MLGIHQDYQLAHPQEEAHKALQSLVLITPYFRPDLAEHSEDIRKHRYIHRTPV
jgi:hypothetical protein